MDFSLLPSARHFICRILLWICFSGLCLTTTANAASWKSGGSLADQGVSVFVDVDSVVIDHKVIAKGWVRFDYDSPRNMAGGAIVGHTSLRMADCSSHRYWVMEDWGTPSAGNEQVSLSDNVQEWRMPIPDSESELAAHALCTEARSLFGRLWEKVKDALPLW